MARAVGIAAEIAAQRDTEAREAQAAASRALQEAKALRADAVEKEGARAALERQAEAARAEARDAQARATNLEQQLSQERRQFHWALAAGALTLLVVLLVFAPRATPAAGAGGVRGGPPRRRPAASGRLHSREVLVAAGGDRHGRPQHRGQDRGGAARVGRRVVVGRNPAQAGVVLDHPEAVREHFRLTARDSHPAVRLTVSIDRATP